MDNPVTAILEHSVVKELIGLELKAEYTARCCACDKPLFNVLKVKDDPMVILDGKDNYVEVKQYRFISNCPYCKCKSWILKVDGTVYVGPIGGETAIANIEMPEPAENMLNVIEVVKCRK